MLSGIHCYTGQGTALYVYNCLINPLFAFSYVVYDTLTQADSTKLQVLQNNCIRVCLKCDKLTPRQVLYETNGIKPLADECKEHTCTIVYKGLNQEATLFLNNLFTRNMDRNSKPTRSAIQGSVYIPKARLKLTEGNIRTRRPKYYNQVSMSIRQVSINTFRSRLKKGNVFANQNRDLPNTTVC